MSRDTVVATKAIAAKVAVETMGDERKVTFVVSSAGLDRDYERVDVKSLRLPLKGGGFVVAKDLNGTQTVDIPWLLNHSFDVEDVIGSVRTARYDAAADELIFEFGVSKRAKAQDMLLLIEEGHLDNAVSITMSDYVFDEDSSKIYDAELIEVSLVFRGANKDARLLAVKSLIKGDEMAEAKTLAEKKAEVAALQKEIDAEEAQEVVPEPAETPEEEQPAPEAEELKPADPVEEPAPETEEPAETPAPVEEVEEHPPQETKSVKKEEPKMNDVIVKQVKDVPEVPAAETPKEDQLDKYEFTAKQFSAFVRGDKQELAELNQKAIDSYKDAKSKATYMNTGVTADGGAIVPSNELMRDVFTLLGNYSTVSNDLRVVTLSEGNGIDVATLVTDVVVSEVTAEGGNKPVTKPVLGDGDVSLREFAGIAIITKKLVRQAAISVYDLLTESFARAIANQRAIMALTDASSGIVNKAGVVDVNASATAVTGYTYDDIKKMPYRLPVAAVQGSKYYISRELLEVLDSAKDTTGRDLDLIQLDGDGLSGTFKNKYRFAVEEVLGKSGAPHAVFGNMGRFGILLRQGTLESETFDTGTVVDGSSVTHNLLQQNKLAQRVAFYENVGYPLPGAFAVLRPKSA
ncbi:phage major capsid protein [Prescottella equi]|uniref:phage major capsid protein n=1 Tax=Rhodococcus hoagii TaxID=43767 RepID=UPI001F5B7ED4|nr:phage major capsid protein [Prescottella equi]UNQ40945.1 phage major capsid protein [Prescottella equi]